MLREFIVERTFEKLTATVRVYCNQREADVLIRWDRRIRHIQAVPFHEVATPELADAWLGRNEGSELGGWIEFHASMFKRDPNWLRETNAA